jgi:hypothetical protein
VAAVRVLADILRRMQAHQEKKRSMLRQLRLASAFSGDQIRLSQRNARGQYVRRNQTGLKSLRENWRTFVGHGFSRAVSPEINPALAAAV